MTNILQNVTKANALLQLKRTAVGTAIVAPVVGFFALIAYLVSNDYLNGMTVYVVLQTALCIFALWCIGGAYESYKNMKRVEKEYKEHKTQRAFERLGNGNT